jgi:hypothetical protein
MVEGRYYIVIPDYENVPIGASASPLSMDSRIVRTPLGPEPQYGERSVNQIHKQNSG